MKTKIYNVVNDEGKWYAIPAKSKIEKDIKRYCFGGEATGIVWHMDNVCWVLDGDEVAFVRTDEATAYEIEAWIEITQDVMKKQKGIDWQPNPTDEGTYATWLLYQRRFGELNNMIGNAIKNL